MMDSMNEGEDSSHLLRIIQYYIYNLFKHSISSSKINYNIITNKCYSFGLANAASRGIAQCSFYNFKLFPALTFERLCWVDI